MGVIGRCDYQPALLFVGSPREITLALITSVVGIIALAAGFEGWLRIRASILERALLILGGLVLIYPGWLTDAIGAISIAVVLFLQFIRAKVLKAAPIRIIR